MFFCSLSFNILFNQINKFNSDKKKKNITPSNNLQSLSSTVFPTQVFPLDSANSAQPPSYSTVDTHLNNLKEINLN